MAEEVLIVPGQRSSSVERDVLSYIMDLADAKARRKSPRLAVNQPLAWSVAGEGGGGDCFLVDVSREGLGVEFLRDADGYAERIGKGSVLRFRILLPERSQTCVFEAEVCWILKMEGGKKACYAGLKYRETSSGDRIAILKYAWDQVHRRRIRRVATVFLAAAFFLSAFFAAGYSAVASRTRTCLVISEEGRIRLESVLVRLNAELEEQRKTKAENESVLKRQGAVMREQDETVRRQTGEIKILEFRTFFTHYTLSSVLSTARNIFS